MPAATPLRQARPIGTVSEAEALVAEMLGTMAELTGIIGQETALVRAARLIEAMRLAPQKAELARRYFDAAAAVKSNSGFLSQRLPARSAELRRRHEEFQTLLRSNLTVLATAHSVSESIIRGAATELARKSAPRTYGSSGRPSAPRVRTAQPIAFSRSL